MKDCEIIMIVSHFQPPITGGEIYNYKLFKYLKVNYSVDVITLYDTPYRFKFGFLLRNIWFIKEICKKDTKKILLIEDIVRSSDIFLFNFIIRHIRKLLKKDVKIIPLVYHTYSPLMGTKIQKKFKHKNESIFLNESDKIITISEYTQNNIKNLLDAEKEILISYPGLNKIKIQNYRKKNQCLNLLFVGSVTSRKGVDTLVESLKIVIKDYGINDVVLHIAGDLTKEKKFSEKIKEYVKNMGISANIIFHGRVSDKKLNELYDNSDIFVFPSLLEGFGMVLIEAMYHKLPILSTNAGAIPFLVKEGENGFLTTPNNPVMLADNIKKLIESPELREEIGEYNHKFAQRFDWNETFRKIEDFIMKDI